MIEEPAFYPNLSGYENRYLLSLLDKKITKEIINTTLHSLGLDEKKDVLYKDYSIGMKKRLYLASALLKESNILLLDEPFSGIDPISIKIIESIIKQLAVNGTSILITSHNIRELQPLLDKAIFLEKGEIIFNSADIQHIDLFDEFTKRVSKSGDAQ